MTTKTTSSLTIASTSTSRLERGLVDLHTNGHLATVRVEGLLTHDSNGTDRGVVGVAIIPRGSARGYHVRLSASVASYGRTVVEAMDHLLTWEEVPGVWTMRDETITGRKAKEAFAYRGLRGSRLTEESHAYFSARTLKDVAEVLRHLTTPEVLLDGLETVARAVVTEAEMRVAREATKAAELTKAAEDAVLTATASALERVLDGTGEEAKAAALDILTGAFGLTTAKGILARTETPTPTVARLRHALDLTRAAERNAAEGWRWETREGGRLVHVSVKAEPTEAPTSTEEAADRIRSRELDPAAELEMEAWDALMSLKAEMRDLAASPTVVAREDVTYLRAELARAAQRYADAVAYFNHLRAL